jgi:hypothetical protein
MLDLIIPKNELIEMFNNETIKDSNQGWVYKDSDLINIIALHEKNPKYIYDVTDAQYYKLVSIKKN